MLVESCIHGTPLDDVCLKCRTIENTQLFAWVGKDELNDEDTFGLKQGSVPAGLIPMVSIDQKKLDKYWPQAEALAAAYGKKIRLVRYRFAEVIRETKEGV